MTNLSHAELDKQTITKAYARWAPVYDLVFGAVFERGRHAAIAAAERIGGRILEVGVGTGISLPHYSRDCRLCGVDISEPMLRKAQDRVAEFGLSNVEGLWVMDAERLSFPDEFFDVVVAQYVVTTVPNPEATLDEFARVLKPGGEIVLVSRVGAEAGLRRALEHWFAPAARKLGWRTEFSFERYARWAGANRRRAPRRTARHAAARAFFAYSFRQGGRRALRARKPSARDLASRTGSALTVSTLTSLRRRISCLSQGIHRIAIRRADNVTTGVEMGSFLEALRTQRWDDHRYYHHSRINQSLHFVSAISFLFSYVMIFKDPAISALAGWLVAMTTRQAGHFFFEPKDYDEVNHASHEYKERIKVGYNLRRKVVLLTIWVLSPLPLYFDPTLFGIFTPHATKTDFVRHVAEIWLAVGIGGVLFRTVQLFLIKDVQTGLVWAAKILTDPFHDIKLYHKAPLALLRGDLIDPEIRAEWDEEEVEEVPHLT